MWEMCRHAPISFRKSVGKISPEESSNAKPAPTKDEVVMLEDEVLILEEHQVELCFFLRILDMKLLDLRRCNEP